MSLHRSLTLCFTILSLLFATACDSSADPDCAGVTCGGNCGQDQIRKRVEGRCCDECSAKPPECKQAEADYQDEVSKLTTTPSATSCTTDADCSILHVFPDCGVVCQAVPVNVGSVVQLESDLKQWAESHCGVCGVPLRASCPAALIPVPVCENGACVGHSS